MYSEKEVDCTVTVATEGRVCTVVYRSFVLCCSGLHPDVHTLALCSLSLYIAQVGDSTYGDTIKCTVTDQKAKVTM